MNAQISLWKDRAIKAEARIAKFAEMLADASIDHLNSLQKIKSLEARIAELGAAQGEPVAWMIESNVSMDVRCITMISQNEQEIDRFVSAYQAMYAGSNRVKIPLYTAPPSIAADKVAPAVPDANRGLIEWVCERWDAEVANRPLVNVHRRNLDSTWRQMLRHLGADDRSLLGPKHDELLAAAPKETGK